MNHFDALRFPGKSATLTGLTPVHYIYGHEMTDNYQVTDRKGVARILRQLCERRDADGAVGLRVLDAEYVAGTGFDRIRQDRRVPNRGETTAQCDAAVVAACDDLAYWIKTCREISPVPVVPYQGLTIIDPTRAGWIWGNSYQRGKHEEWKLANALLWSTSLRAEIRRDYLPLFAYSDDYVTNGWWSQNADVFVSEASGTGHPPILQLSVYDFYGRALSPKSVFIMAQFAEENGCDVVWWQSGWAWARAATATTPAIPPKSWDDAMKDGGLPVVLELAAASVAGGVA